MLPGSSSELPHPRTPEGAPLLQLVQTSAAPSSAAATDAAGCITVRDLIGEYLAFIERRGRSANTIRLYSRYLGNFADYAGDRAAGAVSSREIELEFIAGWANQRTSERGKPPAPGTLRILTQALHNVYGFGARFDLLHDEQGNCTRNPMLAIEIPRAQQRANDWLRAAEDETLLATRMTARERTIIQLLRWTGLRIQEALLLLVSDIDLERDEIHVRKSKTARGVRTIPIFPPLRSHLDDWLSYAHPVPPVPDRPFLITRHGDPMHHQYVRHTVKRIADRAGIRPGQNVTPHTLRRTFGSDLLNRGLRLEVVSRLLGHTSTRTTETAYAELLDQTIRDEALAVFR
jgi:integrase